MANDYILPENKQPLNQQAHRWLERAKAPSSPALLYLTQLAHWGLEKGVEVQEAEVEQNDLREQVNVLLAVKENAGREQAATYRWLLSNPNSPSPKEQAETLEGQLQQAKNPLEAAAAVLEMVSSRMAADSGPTPE